MICVNQLLIRSGKVKHDDSPDGMSLFENEIRIYTVTKLKLEGDLENHNILCL